MSTRRMVISFDEDTMRAIMRIAGPFGEAGRVLRVALGECPAPAKACERGKLTERVEVTLTIAEHQRIGAIAAVECIQWQEAARRVVDTWVAQYSSWAAQRRQAG